MCDYSKASRDNIEYMHITLLKNSLNRETFTIPFPVTESSQFRESRKFRI